MKSQTNDRNIDDDPTIRIRALRTTSSSAVGLRAELYDPAAAELSWDVLKVLRLMTPPAPRNENSYPRAVTSPARVAALHSRPTQKAAPMVVLATVVLATMLPIVIVTGTARRLAAIGRRHGISLAKTLSLLAIESVARVRRQVTSVAFLRSLQARWRVRAVSGGIGQRDASTMSLLVRRH